MAGRGPLGTPRRSCLRTIRRALGRDAGHSFQRGCETFHPQMHGAYVRSGRNAGTSWFIPTIALLAQTSRRRAMTSLASISKYRLVNNSLTYEVTELPWINFIGVTRYFS